MLSAVEVLRAINRHTVPGILVRMAAVPHAALSAGINYLSVRVPAGHWLVDLASPSMWARLGIHGLSTGGAGTAYDFRFPTGPIWGDITLLRRHLASVNPEGWLDHRVGVGVVLLGVGIACLVATATGAGTMPGHYRAGVSAPLCRRLPG